MTLPEAVMAYFRPENTWRREGDCIGLGPSYGKPGNYIQSDIQFAQQVRDDFRFFLSQQSGELASEADMKIYAHMFILQLRNSANKVMASELRIDYSDVFKQLKIPNNFTDQKVLLPQIHGKDMGNHLRGDFELDLTGKVIHKYIFDHETHFVGFGVYDTKTQTDKNVIGSGADMSTV